MMKVVIAAFVLSLVLCFSNGYSVQDLVNVMTPTATSAGCVSFSPFVDGLSPDYASIPSDALIEQLLNVLVSQTSYRCIMIYDMSGPYTSIVRYAEQLGIKVLAHVYISDDFVINNITGAIQTANTYKNTVMAISCGSEVALGNNDLPGTAKSVASCVSQMRAGGVTQPIGYIDVPSVWCSGVEYPCTNKYAEMSGVVDFIGLDLFPYWQNQFSSVWPCVPATEAANLTLFQRNYIQDLYSDIPVLITEFGWPGSSSASSNIVTVPNVYTGQTCGVANLANQAMVNQQIINMCAAQGVACNLFEAFNEQWKGNGVVGDVNEYWGICSGSSSDNYACFNAPTGVNGVSPTTTTRPIVIIDDTTEAPTTTTASTTTVAPTTTVAQTTTVAPTTTLAATTTTSLPVVGGFTRPPVQTTTEAPTSAAPVVTTTTAVPTTTVVPTTTLQPTTVVPTTTAVPTTTVTKTTTPPPTKGTLASIVTTSTPSTSAPTTTTSAPIQYTSTSAPTTTAVQSTTTTVASTTTAATVATLVPVTTSSFSSSVSASSTLKLTTMSPKEDTRTSSPGSSLKPSMLTTFVVTIAAIALLC